MIVGLSILFHLVSGATLDIELEIFDSTPALLYKSTLAGLWNSLHRIEGIPLAEPVKCPPRHMNTSAGKIIPRTRPIATGSGTQIRVSRDHLWVVKTLVGEDMEFRDMFNDLAYCIVFHPGGVAPIVARILRTSEMDPQCRLRTMICLQGILPGEDSPGPIQLAGAPSSAVRSCYRSRSRTPRQSAHGRLCSW